MLMNNINNSIQMNSSNRNKSPRFRSRFMNKRNSNMIMSLILMILNHSRRIFSTKPWRSLRIKATVTT